MDVAFSHYQDWQRGHLNKVARAFLDLPLGDFCLLVKFKSEGDHAWAEDLMSKVQGHSVRHLEELEGHDRPDSVPRQQGLGIEQLERREIVRQNLSTSFNNIDEENDLVGSVEETGCIEAVEEIHVVDIIEISDILLLSRLWKKSMESILIILRLKK
jgi:hypothetical protein